MQNRISILEPEVAKRIAAGEVIDRPASALRELLDNAIDAGAQNISVELEGGGIELLRIVDDGSGMGKDDLLLSIAPHATSKITRLDDLLSLSSLGFRGEALSSIASVASIEIVSAEQDGNAWLLESHPGKKPVIKPCSGIKGSSVTVKNLFADFPARKRFLKRASAEAALAKTVFTDKAAAWPDIFFRLSSGKKPLLMLPPDSLKNRILSALIPDLPKELFRDLVASGQGFNAKLVAGLPAVNRNDRRYIHVYINGRRVQEYAIVQALEYAYRGILPGGTWPYIFAFLEVEPSEVDFNIHPAKKEVRLRNIEDIRNSLISSIRSYFGNQSRLQSEAHPNYPFNTSLPGRPLPGLHANPAAEQNNYSYAKHGFSQDLAGEAANSPAWAAIAESAAKVRAESSTSFWKSAYNDPSSVITNPDAPDHLDQALPYFKYIGQAFGVFLLFEQEGQLFFLDQHAAHERKLYDTLVSGKIISQELLVPFVYEPESKEEDEFLQSLVKPLLHSGYKINKEGSAWLLTAAPALIPEAMTAFVFSMIKENPDISSITEKIIAQTACKAAIKEGESLDEASAIALIKTALALPHPFCPHGRPIFTKISRDELYKAVKRIV